MPKVTAAEFAEKWQRRLQSAAPDITRGVNRVDTAPTQKAAAKKDKMLTNLTAAVQNGKWEAGLNRVTLADWKKAMTDKGIPRISQGVTSAGPKVQQFASQLLSYQEGLQSQIDSMPDLTLQDSINRMTAWVQGMANFKRG